MIRRGYIFLILLLVAYWFSTPVNAEDTALTLVVMDPLAKPLSCPCVEGYAQRDYDQLANFLERETGHDVRVVYSESLTALQDKVKVQADLVIGKDSVVRSDAESAGSRMAPLAQLTGKDGETTQTGLFVVPAADAAQRVEDLGGYRILLGPAECAEKHSAAVDLLTRAGVALPDQRETTAACSDGACRIIEWGDTEQAAAVISSYAQPLLEGCGTIEKGELRVVGETEPVPFITVFVNTELPVTLREELRHALFRVALDAELRSALETLNGFVAPPSHASDSEKKN